MHIRLTDRPIPIMPQCGMSRLFLPPEKIIVGQLFNLFPVQDMDIFMKIFRLYPASLNSIHKDFKHLILG